MHFSLTIRTRFALPQTAVPPRASLTHLPTAMAGPEMRETAALRAETALRSMSENQTPYLSADSNFSDSSSSSSSTDDNDDGGGDDDGRRRVAETGSQYEDAAEDWSQSRRASLIAESAVSNSPVRLLRSQSADTGSLPDESTLLGTRITPHPVALSSTHRPPPSGAGSTLQSADGAPVHADSGVPSTDSPARTGKFSVPDDDADDEADGGKEDADTGIVQLNDDGGDDDDDDDDDNGNDEPRPVGEMQSESATSASNARTASRSAGASRRMHVFVASYAHHVFCQTTSKLGTGLLKLCQKYSFVKHIAYSILRGRPVLLVAPKESDRCVRVCVCVAHARHGCPARRA